MKFKPEVVKTIFQYIINADYQALESNHIVEIPEDEKAYHFDLLIQSGYVTASPIKTKDLQYPLYLRIELTMSGNEFAAQLLNEKAYNKAMEKLKVVGGFASMQTLKIFIEQAYLGLMQ